MGLVMTVFLCKSVCVCVRVLCGVGHVSVSKWLTMGAALCTHIYGSVNMYSFSQCKLGTLFQGTLDMLRTGKGGRGGAGMVAVKKVRRPVWDHEVVHGPSCHSSLISFSPAQPAALWEMVENERGRLGGQNSLWG